MQIRFAIPLLASVLLTLPRTGFAASEIEALHRIYSMSPVSATNPVVARVPECGIEIPASEFQAFIEAEGPIEDTGRTFTLPEKRALMERLVDEHLFLWNAYEHKWDQQEGVARMLTSTRNLMLVEALTEKEVNEKVKMPQDYERLSGELRDRCFEKIDIVVSRENYEELKAAAKRLKDGGVPSPPEKLRLRLANSKLGAISIGDFLQAYAAIPADKQPDLQQPENATAILKKIWGQAALAAEAAARSLDQTPEFREGLQLNRNVLTRFYAQDRVTDKAVARLKSPEGQRCVRRWYETHLQDRYTFQNADGKPQPLAFDKEHESIENDYFEELREDVRAEEARALRNGRQVRIDDEALENIRITGTAVDPAGK